MTDQEKFLIMLLDGPELDSNSKAFLLQQYIQEEGLLSEEAAAKVRQCLEKGKTT